MIATIIGVSILSGGWFLMQIQRERMDFSIPDINGNTVTLSDYSGEVVLIDFMATWCGPCRASMPSLVSLHEEIGDHFVIISISVDPAYDTIQVLEDWSETFGATWIHARDLSDPPVTQQFKISSIPTFVIIDREGEIRYKHGPVPPLKLKTEILSLINE
jgi:thiol-disulfide isomerase/thioredoxin